MLERLRQLLDPPSIQRLEVHHDGRTYPVIVRRDARARRYTLRVKPSTREAVLTMPERGSLSLAKDFAYRHGGWLAARFRKLPGLVDFATGARVPLRGVEHVVTSRPGARGTVWTETPVGELPLLVVAGDPEFLSRRVRDFLKREARRDLEAAVAHHAGRLSVPIRRISVKDTTSRWGSCAADGTLSFSWRLILAPPFVLDYLAAHEVAHRVEMNHSARYWRVVASLIPDYEVAEAWLKRHGSALHSFG